MKRSKKIYRSIEDLRCIPFKKDCISSNRLCYWWLKMSTVEETTHLHQEEMEQRGQVKRPMNAFMLWSKEKRRQISSVDPSLHNSHISKILGEEWKNLPVDEKDPYIKQSKSLMDKHKKEHPDYHYKPRQNKLTKALKELSSLHSPLSMPAGFASKMRSLSYLSAFVNVPRKVHYQPYPSIQRSHMFQKQRQQDRSNLLYHDMPPYHSPAAVSCSGACSCSSGCIDSSSLYMAAQPSYGCTCSRECVDNLNWMAHHHHHRHLSHTRSLAADLGEYRASSPSPALLDSHSRSLTHWKHQHAHPRYGWSLKDLADVHKDSSRFEHDETDRRHTMQQPLILRSSTSYGRDESSEEKGNAESQESQPHKDHTQ